MARRTDGPVIHFATRSDAEERIHMGEALCRAGYAARTEGEQYVSGDWAYVTCRTCHRQLAAHNAREAREATEADVNDARDAKLAQLAAQHPEADDQWLLTQLQKAAQTDRRLRYRD